MRFDLTQLLGAGDDGSAYLAKDGAGGHVFVHRLKKPSFERRRELEQRLKRRALLTGNQFVELLHVDLEGPEPHVVMERIEGSLEQLISSQPLERDLALKVCLSVARALAEAHRL